MMGIGSKTVLAAVCLLVVGAAQKTWKDCPDGLKRSKSVICMVKNSGEIIRDQLKAFRIPGR